MKNYPKLTTGIVVAWFLFSLTASALHLFKNDASRIGLAVAIAALAPIVVLSLWFAASESFRHSALSLSPHILTPAQALRLALFTSILVEVGSTLPTVFAFPAGYGHMPIGA